MPAPLLSLCMIVRDEERALGRTFESVRGWVDKWCVLDTGSEDKTIRFVLNALATEEGPLRPESDGGNGFRRYPLQGTLHKIPRAADFDYAEARNRVLGFEEASAEPATWALSLSADETFHGGDRLRAFLESSAGEEDALLVEVRTPRGAFDYPRLLRVGSSWRYEGKIHEEPVHQVDRKKKPTTKVPGCWIEYAPTDPARLARRLRERDLPLLAQQLAEATDPEARARIVLLLAQTREELAETCAGDVAASSQEMFAALGWYYYLSMSEGVPSAAARRAVERYLNISEILGIYLPRGDGLVPRLQHALNQDPKNPAVAYMLARHVASIDGSGRVLGDAREGLRAAQRAVSVALEAVSDPKNPHDPHGLLWRSHYVAAVCARALGHGPAARKSAEAGVQAGGPEDVFAPFLR